MQVTVETTGTLERKHARRTAGRTHRAGGQLPAQVEFVGRTAKLKGFRPGKVPPKVVKQRYGKQIREEVLGEVMQKSYTDAVVQENLRPGGGPQIETEDNKDTAKVSPISPRSRSMPKVELKDLDKIEIEVPEVTIGDADMDDMIEKPAAAEGGLE